MKCPERGDQWCAYYFGGRCHIDDWYVEKSGCDEPHIVSLSQDTHELLDAISPEDLQAQIDVCEMIIKSAVPNDPADRMQIAETAQVREICETFLEMVGCKKLFEGFEREAETPDTVVVEESASKEESDAEWV